MHVPSSGESCVVLVFIVGVTVGGGFAAVALTGAADDYWYENLTKPSWTPPDTVFSPVWTTVYLLMAFAAFLVWRRGGFLKQALPLSVYTVQLVANLSWVFIYIEAQELLAAFIEMCCLWVLILITAVLFGRVRKSAAVLLVPYLVWVIFVGVLNYEVYRLNKEDDSTNATSDTTNSNTTD